MIVGRKSTNKIVLLLMVVLLSACKVDLYRNLTEQDANQMLALLLSNHIAAVKEDEKNGTLLLRVEKQDFVKAVEVMRQNGYPKRSYRSVNDLFPSGQLITSPTQERTKINYLKEQSLEEMLANIEGVITANVTIAMPIGDDNGQQTPYSPSASVLVKYSPDTNMQSFSSQIKDLIYNSIPGIAYENIALVLQPTSYRFVTNPIEAVNMVSGPVVNQPKNMTVVEKSNKIANVSVAGTSSANRPSLAFLNKVKWPQVTLALFSLLALICGGYYFWLYYRKNGALTGNNSNL